MPARNKPSDNVGARAAVSRSKMTMAEPPSSAETEAEVEVEVEVEVEAEAEAEAEVPKGKIKRQSKCRDGVGTRIQLRCTAIQKYLLDHTTGSEKSIRQMFGNNPDTSKALRMLVKQHRVKRFGTGGKLDPFVYMALIPPGVKELEMLTEAIAGGFI